MIDDPTTEEQAATDAALDTLNGFGVDGEKRLLWKGQLVKTQRRITLSFWPAVAATLVAFGATAQGVLATYQFGCIMNLWVRGCSK